MCNLSWTPNSEIIYSCVSPIVGCLEYTTKIPHNLLSIPVSPEVNNCASLTMNSQDTSQFPLLQIENSSFDYVMMYCVYGYVLDRAYIAIICFSTFFLLCVTLYLLYNNYVSSKNLQEDRCPYSYIM